jgi:tRNA(Ile)-lysidine synthase
MNVHSLSNSPLEFWGAQAASLSEPAACRLFLLSFPAKTRNLFFMSGSLIGIDEFARDFPPRRRYLIGVSGGRDSVTLLHWLKARGYGNLIISHLNHQLRGRSAAADARFVENLATKYEVDFELGYAEVRALAAKGKKSLETAARDARYSFFARIAKRKRCHTIFLGHHADDLVETFLLNLFRGAGATGLSAMREISTRPIDDADLTVVRPFLGVWRAAIDKYVREQGLKFREDASNRGLTPLRNRIRGRVIPYLEKTIGRNIRQSIWRTATIMAEEESFFEALLPEKLSALTPLTVEPLRKMALAVQRRMLHKWLRAGDVPDLTFDLVERVRGLLDLTKGVAKTNLPGDRHARRRAGKIFME